VVAVETTRFAIGPAAPLYGGSSMRSCCAATLARPPMRRARRRLRVEFGKTTSLALPALPGAPHTRTSLQPSRAGRSPARLAALTGFVDCRIARKRCAAGR
jgi:hypothetical protein